MVRIHFTGPPQEEPIQVFLYHDSIHVRLGKEEPGVEYNMNKGSFYEARWIFPQIGKSWLETRGRYD